MRIIGEVLSASTNGDSISVRLQGTVKRAAPWRRMSVVEFDVPDSTKSQRAFHIGRRVAVTVKPL